ncbi:MAG TPA: Spy/CpxP family protein refolding chaperone [Ramlibacter sp.]|uniref:Spy/CpxP family protein refolding chaperone n=1 Tax=Ramlibacter sp. TaxID=1917967 RepID=UPI002C0C161C|nr:Spy/CpxP family protein refolding chaperone [Ramlibacter sp.]HVZ44452.1 Spy/CpxP family protein refolding chaperone [Ramlibacter sp.]
MRTWIRRTLITALGASIVFGGLAACSHRYDHHSFGAMSAEDRAKIRDKVIGRVTSRLDLNAEQQAKLRALADKLEAQRMALVGQGTYQRADIRNLFAGEKFDRAKAQAIVNEKTAAVEAKSPEVVAALGDFYDSLSPAQQAKAREFMERRGRHGWR